MIKVQWLNKLLQWLRIWSHLKGVPKGRLALKQNLFFPTKFQGSVLTHKEITEKLANVF